MHFEVWTKLKKKLNLLHCIHVVCESQALISLRTLPAIVAVVYSSYQGYTRWISVLYLIPKLASQQQFNYSQESLRQITFDDWSERIFPLFMKMFLHILYTTYMMSSWCNRADEIRSCITETFLFASSFSSPYITNILTLLITSYFAFNLWINFHDFMKFVSVHFSMFLISIIIINAAYWVKWKINYWHSKLNYTLMPICIVGRLETMPSVTTIQGNYRNKR